MSADQITSIKLNYEKAGWTRCLNTDLQFKWVWQGQAGGQRRGSQEAGEAGEGAGASADADGEAPNPFKGSAFEERMEEESMGKTIDDMAFVRELKQDAKNASLWHIRLIAAEESSMSTMVNGHSLAQVLDLVTLPVCED